MLGSAKTNLPLLTLTSWVKGTSSFVLFPQRLSVFWLPYLQLVLFKYRCWPGPLMIKHSLSKSTDINEDFVKSADNSDKARQAVISYVLSMWEMSFRGNFLYRAMHCIDKGWKSQWQNFLFFICICICTCICVCVYRLKSRERRSWRAFFDQQSI